ncbi:hypothetical protein GLOIN_2v1781787 [Rhizophagus irregularis DAOM 181602=DAOM 197198]|nr:hypothetical protein GLOIN_2v1781787 [Rhizophagus irregularis DAOM 181602=DAOM 197198]
MLLFKLFIENEVNLHIFEIDNPTYNSYFEDILELMLQNPNFTHNIRNLKLYISINHDSITNTSIKNRISQVINTHQILKKIVLCYRSLYLYQSLLLSNNCSNSLNTITFYYINFHGIINLDKVFDQLNVLESVHMVYCSSLNNDFIQQIVNLTKPFKLKSLFIGEMSQIESLELLLQKSSNYLENFGYGSGYRYKLPFKQQLSELVIKYCKNIKFLDLYELDYQIICLALNLIENIRQNLNYLSIGVCETLFSIGAIERSSIILRNLGQHFTFRLEYLCLTLNIKMNDFEIFLKNSQNTFIKKLLINNRGGDDILSCIKENIMKKKRVKYLAIIETTFDEYDENIYEDKELFLLKNEVKEFELYDIIIQEYSDLVIYTNTDFAKKLE